MMLGIRFWGAVNKKVLMPSDFKKAIHCRKKHWFSCAIISIPSNRTNHKGLSLHENVISRFSRGDIFVDNTQKVSVIMYAIMIPIRNWK